MGVFRLDPAGIDQDELELDLIDHGLEEMGESSGRRAEKPQLVSAARSMTSATCKKRLGAPRHHAVIGRTRIHLHRRPIELPEEQANEALELIDRLEQDDDVQKVYHTLA